MHAHAHTHPSTRARTTFGLERYKGTSATEAVVPLHALDLCRTNLICEAPNEYVLYGTGRKNCRAMYARLELPPRHDLVVGMMTVMKVESCPCVHAHT
jgi:hypothetical protein